MTAPLVIDGPMNGDTLGQRTPLAGMTKEAIASWHTKISASTDAALIEPVVRILNEISARAALLVDNSRDVFEQPNASLSVESITELSSLLEGSLDLFKPQFP